MHTCRAKKKAMHHSPSLTKLKCRDPRSTLVKGVPHRISAVTLRNPGCVCWLVEWLVGVDGVMQRKGMTTPALPHQRNAHTHIVWPRNNPT